MDSSIPVFRTEKAKPVYDELERLGWRRTPGVLGKHPSTSQSVHTLLGYYLQDRYSPTPFPGRDSLHDHGLFEWGVASPLEKVIRTEGELDALMRHPDLYRHSIAILEPWPDVGINTSGESVRASKNIAYIAQQLADADSILFPLWETGIWQPNVLANLLSSCLAVFVEGGNPSAHDPSSFEGSKASRDELLDLVDLLMLARSSISCPAIYICLGHQLAAQSHIRLLKRAVSDVLDLSSPLPLDDQGFALDDLKRLCEHIRSVGSSLQVIKQREVVAQGWDEPMFAVAPNEAREIGTRRLQPYDSAACGPHIPRELVATHAYTADELEGVIDTIVGAEREVSIEMFHSDEVNEEAILFANWAYKSLHDALVPVRHKIAVGPLSWLLNLPYSVEILCQTEVEPGVVTEVSTTAIYYRDWETRQLRRSFSMQFHPELMADIRDIGKRNGPSYAELKDNDGVRLMARLLYHGMQE